MMLYWEGPKKIAENLSKTTLSFQAHNNAIIASSVYLEESVLQINNIAGPQRKTPWEQKFLMTMCLCLGLLIKDLPFRFKFSPGHVSQIWIT